MQDKILLGFLMDGSKTGYEIKRTMEQSTEFFFTTSLGSIYPAFKKLERDGLVVMTESIEAGRLKKEYSITPAGKRVFSEWISQKPGIAKIRDEAILKVFFFHYLSPGERKTQMEGYLEELHHHIEKLQSLKNRLEKMNIDTFQMSTLDLGIEYFMFMNSWYSGFLDALKEKNG